MHRSIFLSVFSTLASRALAQGADFVNMTWGAVQVGQMWPISWSVGNGNPITIAFGNTTWNEIVASSISAIPSTYDWTIVVPDGFVSGNYVLSLTQNGAGTTYSPLFGVSFGDVPPPPANVTSGTSSMVMPTSTSNASMTAAPTVTVIWWDPDCTCHRTSMSAGPAAATGGAPATMSTWYDHECGCTKSVLAPAPTMAPAGNNYTAPMTTPNPPAASPAAPQVSAFQGAADTIKIGGWTLGIVALIAAGMSYA